MAKGLTIKVDTSDVLRNMKNYSSDVQKDVQNITEAYTRKMANDAANNAPIDTGLLKNSLASSPQQVSEYVWEFGSELPYATRQEYENATKKAFVRNSVAVNEPLYKQALEKAVKP